MSESPDSTEIFEDMNRIISDDEQTDTASEIHEEVECIPDTEDTYNLQDGEHVECHIDADITEPTVEEESPPIRKRRILPPKAAETRSPRVRGPPERFGDKTTYHQIYHPTRATNTKGAAHDLTKPAETPTPEDNGNTTSSKKSLAVELPEEQNPEPELCQMSEPQQSMCENERSESNPDQEDPLDQDLTPKNTKQDSSSEISKTEMERILRDKEIELQTMKRILESKTLELTSLKKPKLSHEKVVETEISPSESMESRERSLCMKAIQSLLESKSSTKKSESTMKDSQWTSDRKYITDHWPKFNKHTDIIERVVGLSDWDAQVKNVLSTVHELWLTEWEDMFTSCKTVAIQRQKVASSKAVLLFPEDKIKTGSENKVRRVFADMLQHKQDTDMFKTLSRREKDSPSRLLWTVVSLGLITTAHEMMELSNALGRQWPQSRSSEHLEEQIRRSEEAIECANWYPAAIVPGMGERILLLDKATMSLGEIDRDIGTSYNVKTENMDFDLSQDEPSKLAYYEAIVALVRKRSERKRYLGIQDEHDWVALPAITDKAEPKKPEPKKSGKGKEKGKGKGPKEEDPPPRTQNPAPQSNKPPVTQKIRENEYICGTWHRWGFCPYMDNCRMNKSHTTAHKPPEEGCMCITVLLGGKCTFAACKRRHCEVGAELFKNSRSGTNLTRVKAKAGFNTDALQKQKYNVIDLGPPGEPKRCFNCGMETHKQVTCPQPKATCAQCGGAHKSNYCVEVSTWYKKDFPPVRKDFLKGRVGA